MKTTDSVKSAPCRAFSNLGTPDSERRVMLAAITPGLDQMESDVPQLTDCEKLILECAPGGDICDPQLIADKIRDYFEKRLSPMSIAKYFEKLRNDPAHHIGMGDVRLTMAMQDKVVEMAERGAVGSGTLVRPLATIEVMFRGKWTPVYEVADFKAEVGWNMTLSEPIKQMRVVYHREVV